MHLHFVRMHVDIDFFIGHLDIQNIEGISAFQKALAICPCHRSADDLRTDITPVDKKALIARSFLIKRMFADIAINTNTVEAEIGRCNARSCRFSIDRKRCIDDFAAAGAMIYNLIVCRIAERDLRIAQNKACHKLRNGCCFR